MTNGSNDMLSAKNFRSSKLGSSASVLNDESLSDDVKVGDEKPDVLVGPLAPLLRRPRYSRLPLSMNPLIRPDVGKPMLREAGSKG